MCGLLSKLALATRCSDNRSGTSPDSGPFPSMLSLLVGLTPRLAKRAFAPPIASRVSRLLGSTREARR
jgi:hypothetical protein